MWENITPRSLLVDDGSNLPSTTVTYSIGQVKTLLRRVDGEKEAGKDGIPAWILKTFNEELAPVLIHLYNACLKVEGLFSLCSS